MSSWKRSLILAAFFANLCIILAWWWHANASAFFSPWAGSYLVALGRLAGLLLQFLLLTELLLVGRIRALEAAGGFDRLNRIHQLVGEWLIFLIVAHPLLITLGYAAAAEVTWRAQVVDVVLHWDGVLAAAIGVAFFLVIIGISYPVIRRKLRYETWYFTHLLMYVAVALVFTHQIKQGDIAGTPFLWYWSLLALGVGGLVLGYRFLRPILAYRRHRFVIQSVVKEAADVTSLVITGRAMEKFRFHPGQFAYLNILKRGRWFTHPFSFSTASNGRTIRFSMKASGDFTSNASTLTAGTHVFIDGPLGSFILERAKTEKVLLISGGIGITPIRALFEECVTRGKDVQLLASFRDASAVVFEEEIRAIAENTPRAACEFFVTRGEAGETPRYTIGMLDAEKLRTHVPDLLDRDIFVCGPPPMIMAVRATLRDLGVSKSRIYYERFSW